MVVSADGDEIISRGGIIPILKTRIF